MTTTPETYAGARDREPTVEAVSHAPVLITEHEILVGTAVAVRTRPTTMPWCTEAMSIVVRAIHPMFATLASDARPARRDYPKRYVFLEGLLPGP